MYCHRCGEGLADVLPAVVTDDGVYCSGTCAGEAPEPRWWERPGVAVPDG